MVLLNIFPKYNLEVLVLKYFYFMLFLASTPLNLFDTITGLIVGQDH